MSPYLAIVKRGTPPLLSAVILAGGTSARMGRDKAWIECEGRPLIALALKTLRSVGLREIFISGRRGVDYSALGCPVLLDLKPGQGPLGGVERGLHCCAAPLLLVLAVDLPRMTSKVISTLISRSDALTGVVPERDDRLEPLAAIYPKRCHPLAVNRMFRGSGAARDFAADCLREKAIKTWKVPPNMAACFANWNRPEDVDGFAALPREKSNPGPSPASSRGRKLG